MLAIRLQRRGRKGHAQFRVIVQDSRHSPKSEKVVASLGSYDPHTKTSTLDTEKAEFYLKHGAQPSNRVVRILTDEKVKLPEWVKLDTTGAGTIKNPEKLRKNQPDEPKEAAKDEAPVDAPEEKPSDEAPADEEKAEPKAEEAPKDQKADEKSEEKADEKPEETPAKEDKPAEDKKVEEKAEDKKDEAKKEDKKEESEDK